MGSMLPYIAYMDPMGNMTSLAALKGGSDFERSDVSTQLLLDAAARQIVKWLAFCFCRQNLKYQWIGF